MASWNPGIFIDETRAYYHDAVEWGDVDYFCGVYDSTNYWWVSNAINDYIVQYNNAAAILLLIDKCNDLQSQIDELGGGEVTMAAILSAMIDAEYEQFQNFIGYIDGYRYAIWDSWYNTEYYAGLARGFKEKAPGR